jgi:hypothetical protein
MSCADDCAQVVGILNAVKNDEKFSRGGDLVQFGVFLLRPERDDPLMRLHAGKAIESAAILESYGRSCDSGEVDDFLQAMTSGSASHEDAFEGALCPKRFGDGVNSDENGQTLMIPPGSTHWDQPSAGVDKGALPASSGTDKPLLKRFVKFAMAAIMVMATN